MPRFGTLSGAYIASATQSVTVDPGLADTLTGILWADAVGNLFIEQSADGINWDLSVMTAASIGVGVSISVPIVAPFVRARYVNGAGAANVRCSVRFASAGAR